MFRGTRERRLSPPCLIFGEIDKAGAGLSAVVLARWEVLVQMATTVGGVNGLRVRERDRRRVSVCGRLCVLMRRRMFQDANAVAPAQARSFVAHEGVVTVDR